MMETMQKHICKDCKLAKRYKHSTLHLKAYLDESTVEMQATFQKLKLNNVLILHE